jgi:hypothetical protein
MTRALSQTKNRKLLKGNTVIKYIFFVSLISISALSCGKADHDGIHRWKKTEIEFYINKNANATSEDAIKYAFGKWQEAVGPRFTFTCAGRNWAGVIHDGKNTISFTSDWPKYIPFGNVAFCYKWYDCAGNIEEADIILNSSLAKFTSLATKKEDSYYIEGICMHEIGHLLGLKHIDDEASLMKRMLTIRDSRLMMIDDKTLHQFHEIYE